MGAVQVVEGLAYIVITAHHLGSGEIVFLEALTSNPKKIICWTDPCAQGFGAFLLAA